MVRGEKCHVAVGLDVSLGGDDHNRVTKLASQILWGKKKCRQCGVAAKAERKGFTCSNCWYPTQGAIISPYRMAFPVVANA